jgi:hypothetical protein
MLASIGGYVAHRTVPLRTTLRSSSNPVLASRAVVWAGLLQRVRLRDDWERDYAGWMWPIVIIAVVAIPLLVLAFMRVRRS